MRYFEDVVIGDTIELGSHTFTEDEIIRFGEKYDRQVFHTDPDKARDTPFGGLIASGWQTAAVFMRLFVTNMQAQAAQAGEPDLGQAQYGASPGFDDMVWIKPVHAGDTIAYRTRVIEKRPLKSRPGFGLVCSRAEGFNQKGELVYAFTGKGIVPFRNA